MHLTIHQSVPLDVEAYASLLRDATFVRFRASVPGATVDDVVVTPGDGDAFTVTVRRSMPSDQIPAQVRAFVGSSLEIRQVEAWEPARDGTRHGTVSLDITGTPVRLVGTLVLEPAEGGSRVTSSGDLKAPVPLVGASLERAAAEAVRTTLAAEELRVRAWVDVHGSSDG